MAGIEQVKAALLFLVLELDPEHLSVEELSERMAVDEPKDLPAVSRAATSLMDVGLLCDRDGKLAPTPAALCFNALYI
jgi:hypothetical protein